MKVVKGFTLIELVVVIVILGILAAVAAPKFIDINGDARASVLKSLAGTIKSASDLIHNKAIIEGVEGDLSASLTLNDGTNVLLSFGYPVITDEDTLIRNIVDTDVCFIDTNSTCDGQDTAYEMIFVPTSQFSGAVKIQDNKATDSSQCYMQINNATYQSHGNNVFSLDEPLTVVTVTGGC